MNIIRDFVGKDFPGKALLGRGTRAVLAATLGASLHTPDIILAVTPSASFLPQTATPVDHAPAFFAHFASRAPPLKA